MIPRRYAEVELWFLTPGGNVKIMPHQLKDHLRINFALCKYFQKNTFCGAWYIGTAFPLSFVGTDYNI